MAYDFLAIEYLRCNRSQCIYCLKSYSNNKVNKKSIYHSSQVIDDVSGMIGPELILEQREWHDNCPRRPEVEEAFRQRRPASSLSCFFIQYLFNCSLIGTAPSSLTRLLLYWKSCCQSALSATFLRTSLGNNSRAEMMAFQRKYDSDICITSFSNLQSSFATFRITCVSQSRFPTNANIWWFFPRDSCVLGRKNPVLL